MVQIGPEGLVIAALGHKRSRCHQCRKSWQWQAALGQQDIEKNDQQAVLFDDGNDVLHTDPANLARYIVTIIRGMFSVHSPNLLPKIGASGSTYSKSRCARWHLPYLYWLLWPVSAIPSVRIRI